MARLQDFIAFRAAIALLEERGKQDIIKQVYEKCKSQIDYADKDVRNFVKEIYDDFSDEEVSEKIAELLKNEKSQPEISVIYQKVDNLHKACPKNLGDWYFTGNYPTPGGNRVVNRAFINYYEGNENRAY